MTHNSSKESNDPYENFKGKLKGLLHMWILLHIRHLREYDLTPLQFFVLRYIYYTKNIDLSLLSTFLGVSKSTVTGITDTLENRGLLRRIHNKNDRRIINLELTPKTIDIFTGIEKKTSFVIDEILKSFPEEFLGSLGTELENITDKLSAALSEKNRGGE